MHAVVSALEPIARVTLATVFNSLWEAALLAFAVWVILRLMPNLNASTRYAAWCAALAGSLLLPLATTIPQISVQRSTQSAITRSSAPGPAPQAAASHPPSTAIAKIAAAPAAARNANVPAFKMPERVRFLLPDYLALIVFGVWVAATLLLLLRLAVNLFRLERLKRDALPLPIDYRERLSQWAAAEKGEREVRLCVCAGIDVPVAVGLFDSMILIPHHLLQTLRAEEIDQIMLHELGHLRRADDWTNGLQRVIQTLLFFNPAVAYIAAQLDTEREVACDDWVVRQTKNVRPYATCLTKMAEATAWPHRALAAPGVFVTRRGLSVRVERLLRAGRNVRTSVSLGPAGAVVAALVVLFFVLQNVAPSFAFTKPAAPQFATTKSHARVHKTDAASVQRRVVLVKEFQRVAVAATAAPATPAPAASVITIPAKHIHIPSRTIHVPAVNVDIPERHITVPSPPYAAALSNAVPSDLSTRIEQQVNAAMRLSGAKSGAFDCVGCDYRGQNLAGRSFRGQRLNGVNFSRSNLQNADFSSAVLLGVDFGHADLRGTNFAHAVMNGCDLTHADVTGADFEGVRMTGCNFDARSLSPVQARSLLLACRMGCDFNHANLAGQNLRGLSIVGVNLSGADLRGADFSNGKFSGIDFSGAQLSGAKFTGASLTGCDFSGVDLHDVDLSNAKMTGDKLDRTPMR